MACRTCTTKKCKELPTEDEPLCFMLGGREVEVTQCPHTYIGPHIKQLLALSSLAQNFGVMPTSGGWLDQSAWVIDGMEAVWSEQENQRRELADRGKKID